MRKVQVFKWEQQQDAGGVWRNVKAFDYMGRYHQFAQDDNGEGAQIPVAIVETADGSVRSVYAEMVQFVDARPAAEPAQQLLADTLLRLDGYMANLGYDDDHPWRAEIAAALADAGESK